METAYERAKTTQTSFGAVWLFISRGLESRMLDTSVVCERWKQKKNRHRNNST